ncbi:7357_t:CDS:2, partial [Entrophospora sp. SA101]
RHKEQLKQHNCFKNNDEDQSDEYLKILSERINRIEKLINDLSDKVNSTSPQPLTINGTQVSNSDRLRFTPSSSAATPEAATTKAKIDFSKMNLDELIEFGYSCYLNNNNRRHKEQLKQHNCFKNNDEDQSDEYLKILSERINRIEKLINDLSDKVNSTSPQPLTINGTQSRYYPEHYE